MITETPRPIDGGAVAQVLVEFLGPQTSGVMYRGPSSRREYRFACSPGQCLQYVLVEDEAQFARLPQFLVHTGERIDPERDRDRKRDDELAALRAVVQQLQENPRTPVRRRTGRPVGRPPVPDERSARAWHLHAHCDWPYRAVAAELDIDGVNPEKTVVMQVSRWKQRQPGPLSEAECKSCAMGDSPPRPE